MRALWEMFEVADRAAFATMQKVETLLGKDAYRKRIEKAVEHVRPAQKAIRFEN